ncbi:type VII secretion integral membrane protein EccD [Gordonia hydrophobica]|uniref:Type VII secretion integral membrane protein EccD n=1 Tax=Gordonia hydrophobica TaxID=40516 RepID=A0ABZ2U548_9ACTN|nr:type VII secretion integral membrane protein EccD [Gordonia hydrophobica]MBM7366790.1 type VII secretion integral membrane protein EccD [Gordonia hydrophobica]
MTVSTEPELVRISILGGTTQLDSGLPAHVPLAALIPDLLGALRVSHDGTPAAWTLGRIDGSRLAPAETLAQAGVLDGDLLIVRADRADARSPLVDDVADGVAAALRHDRPGWTAASSRRIGYALFIVGLLAAVPAGRVAATDDRPAVLATAAIGATVLLTVALTARRLGTDPRTGTAATIGAAVLGALTASILVPTVGAGAQVALAAAAAGTIATVGHRVVGHAPAVHVAIATGAVLATAAGGLAALWPRPAGDIAAVVAVLAVVVVLLAPRAAIALGRLPLPTVPTLPPDPAAQDEPSQVDGVDALRLADRDPIGAIAELALGDLRTVADRAATTAAILTGILAGATVVCALATVVVAASADGSTVALVFSACTVAAVAGRGRTHADRLHSAIVVVGAGVTAVLAPLAVLVAGTGPSAFTVFAAVVAVAVGALLLGTVAAGGDYSPPAVRAAEIVEYAVLVSLVPLLLWVLGVYQTIRHL